MTRLEIPFTRPDIGEAEIQEVIETLRSGWLTTGPKTRQLEANFAACVGSKHAVAVNSGTAAMHLALEAMGIARGDRVLTTDYTFTATAEVINYVGADPVFVDVDRTTLNLSIDQVRHALRSDPKIKAIIPVHIAGQACQMRDLEQIASPYNVRILEDAAHAFPSTSEGRTVGAISDATAFSFYATKPLATGEGGMLTTDDDDIAERARIMRLHGISQDVFNRYSSLKASWSYEVVAPGFKYNLTDIAAAIGIHQLKRFDDLWKRRRAIAHRYLEELDGLPLQLPANTRPEEKHAWHLFIVQIDTAECRMDRDTFIEQLADRGIKTSVHFIPLHLQPYWRDRYHLDSKQFPISEHAFRHVVSLPIYSAMTEKEIDYVISSIRDVFEQSSG